MKQNNQKKKKKKKAEIQILFNKLMTCWVKI